VLRPAGFHPAFSISSGSWFALRSNTYSNVDQHSAIASNDICPELTRNWRAAQNGLGVVKLPVFGLVRGCGSAFAISVLDRLAESDPGKAGWQHDLGLSNE
jgi:hypothetical protein